MTVSGESFEQMAVHNSERKIIRGRQTFIFGGLLPILIKLTGREDPTAQFRERIASGG